MLIEHLFYKGLVESLGNALQAASSNGYKQVGSLLIKHGDVNKLAR